MSELKTPEKLRESLDVVDIVLGLLSSGARGDPKLPLKQFINSRKMSKKSFSAKVTVCFQIYVSTISQYRSNCMHEVEVS